LLRAVFTGGCPLFRFQCLQLLVKALQIQFRQYLSVQNVEGPCFDALQLHPRKAECRRYRDRAGQHAQFVEDGEFEYMGHIGTGDKEASLKYAAWIVNSGNLVLLNVLVSSAASAYSA
jgi:hypothetical protein